MGWILFESLIALLVLLAIVGWTMAPLRKRREHKPETKD